MSGSSQNVQVWLVWLIAVLVSLMVPLGIEPESSRAVSAGSGVVIASGASREVFPWLPNHRWRKHALSAYRRARQLYREARYRYEVARGLAYLARHGVLTLAWLMDRLTRRQLRYYLGALPLLYTVLTELRVAETVNRFCPPPPTESPPRLRVKTFASFAPFAVSWPKPRPQKTRPLIEWGALGNGS